MTTTFRVLSWGVGVQSTTLAVMSALGDLEPLDAVIAADTGWERQQTYEALGFYAEWLGARGVRVVAVRAGDIRRQGAEEHIHIPFWTSGGGPLRRQCTRHFKIRPIKREIRVLLGFHAGDPPHPPPASVEQWLGFSWDEFERMKDSQVKFIVNRFPLIERRMTRNDCEDYLRSHGLPVPVKSACIGCPYRQPSEWLEMRDSASAEFADAVEFDQANRHNPLTARAGSTADEIYIYKYGDLATADLAADAKRERQGKQLPLMICDGPCMT